MKAERTCHVEDVELAKEVREGSVRAWHRFVDRYANLILSVVRHQFQTDEDEVRSVFVDILQELYRGGLDTYEGRASLSTWLVVVARRRALDRLRKRLGRRELPEVLESLSPLDQEVFHLYHWDHQTLDAVRHRLETEGKISSGLQLLESLERIESSLGSRTLRRLIYQLEAPSPGAASMHTLEFLDQQPVDDSRPKTPEELLEERLTRERLDRIHQLIESMPEDERRVLNLRFEQKLPAKEIAREMGIDNSRTVYSMIERALKRLRKMAQKDTDRETR